MTEAPELTYALWTAGLRSTWNGFCCMETACAIMDAQHMKITIIWNTFFVDSADSSFRIYFHQQHYNSWSAILNVFSIICNDLFRTLCCHLSTDFRNAFITLCVLNFNLMCYLHGGFVFTVYTSSLILPMIMFLVMCICITRDTCYSVYSLLYVLLLLSCSCYTLFCNFDDEYKTTFLLVFVSSVQESVYSYSVTLALSPSVVS